jgi:hypothetical protein
LEEYCATGEDGVKRKTLALISPVEKRRLEARISIFESQKKQLKAQMVQLNTPGTNTNATVTVFDRNNNNSKTERLALSRQV